jgi:ABC-type polar amino acid transport system ATPase subunit
MRILAEEGMTMLVVTHEIGFARQVADRIVFIEGGVVVEEGPPNELFYNPKTERTREFLWKITELYGHDQEEGQG